MIRAHGFVLFIVLIFLQIFALLSFYGFTMTTTTLKINNELWQREKRLWLAKSLLRQIENEFNKETPVCRIPVMATQHLIKQPISWWQLRSCSGNLAGNEYHYVIEWLGKEPCQVIRNNENNPMRVAEYYRITLLFWLNKTKGRKAFFQSTVTKATEDISSCPMPYQIQVGRQMWREVNQ